MSCLPKTIREIEGLKVEKWPGNKWLFLYGRLLPFPPEIGNTVLVARCTPVFLSLDDLRNLFSIIIIIIIIIIMVVINIIIVIISIIIILLY